MAGAKAPLTFRIFKGDQLLREERLSLSVIKLGKVPSAHLKLDDETVSRMHAIIEVNGPGDVSIIDLGSTKGTFVNGQKVNKAKLQSGDTIVVGETRIELVIGATDEDEPTKVNAGAALSAPDVMTSTPRPPTPRPSTPRPPTPLPVASPPMPMPMPMPQAPLSVPPARPAPAPPAPSQAFSPPPPPPSAFAVTAPAAPAPALRPPPGLPGGAPLYGTPMAPPQGFQQAMAESVDDHGGARAIEVAAMLGDSVVSVKHCIDPRSGKVSPVTYGLFAFAAVSAISAAIAFYISVSNAAYNKFRYDELTQKYKKPGFSFRPRTLSVAYDFVAFGGLLFAIGAATAALARMRSERQSPLYRIGSAPGVEFATEGAPDPEFAMVSPHGDDFAFNFGRGMEGEMILNGQATSLADLAAQGRTTISPIPAGAKIRVRAGKATFLVSAVPQPRRYAGPPLIAVQNRGNAYFAGSLALHLGIWLILDQVPIEDSNVNIDLAAREDLANRSSTTAQDEPPPPEDEDKPDDGAEESGGTGTAMALEEGKMGKKDSDRAEGQYKMKKEQEDPQLARQQAIEQARNAGILGSTSLTQGGAFSSLTGTGDISSGFDDTNIYGGLLGKEAGEMQGGFGFGRSGFGPGGGGTGWGTIGTGRYGTIGHGSGTGDGYGVGGGRGGIRGRTAAVPTVSIGQPNAQGDLDKAIIRRYIKRNQQKIQYCYEKELLAKPALSGTVMTSFLITPNGNVSQATGSGVDPEVASCVASVIKNIEFPKPKGGGNVQVNYPFIFRLGGGG
jgi:pSer/pThr/pTyr-binding forkhead associated (FHA) protein